MKMQESRAVNVIDRARELRKSLTNRADKKYDGRLVGAGGKTFRAGSPLHKIPAVAPRRGGGTGRAIFVNGLPFDKETQTRSMQAIADRSGMNVVGIHNSTEGLGKDLLQALGDKLDLGKNRATLSLAKTIKTELDAGRPLHVMGHSQGGVIVSAALRRVQRQLRAEGLSPSEVERRLSTIRVETFGAATGRFPDGPQYVHYVNRKDPLPIAVGLGPVRNNPLTHPGKGAVVKYFERKGGPGISPGHDLDSIYLQKRVPFAEARADR